MKKLLVVLGFWLACLVPSTILAQSFDVASCQAFSHNAAYMFALQQTNKFATAKDLFDNAFPKDFLVHTDSNVIELMKAFSTVVMIDWKQTTPEEIEQKALNFCLGNEGNIEAMTEELKFYAGEKSL